VGKGTLKAFFMPVTKNSLIVLHDLLEGAEYDEMEASVTLGDLLGVPR
jgi:hypothetical protein